MICIFKNYIIKKINILSELFINPLKILIGTASVNQNKSYNKHFKNLWDAEVKVFSQWGEDGILDYLCFELDLFKPKMLELGSGNFLECNSRFLAENLNASVVAVDSRKDLIPTLESLPIYWKTSILPINTWITPETVIDIQEKAVDFLGKIEILSLDIDGNDYWVAMNLDLSEIRIIVVEYNPLFGSEKAVTIPRKDDFDRTTAHFSNLYYGVSLKAWINHFREHNFDFVGTNRAGNNAFFIASDCLDKLSIPLPNFNDLEIYVDWRVRESRDKRGRLNYLANAERQKLIANMPLIDLETKAEIFVSDLSK